MFSRLSLSCTFAILLLSAGYLYSQNQALSDSLKEAKLRSDFDSLRNIPSDDAKRVYNGFVLEDMIQLLKDSTSYMLNLDSVKNLGKVSSPDNSFRILNWNLSFNDFTYAYYTFIQFNPQGKFGYKVVQLKEQRGTVDTSIESKQFTKDNWYGALIYKIISTSYRQHDYYTLLAIDYNNLMSQFKFIDVLTFDKSGNPLFGAPIFKSDKGIKSRILFEYSAQVSIGLRFDDKVKMIVFDHLSPAQPEMTGDYKFYGPDFSYDAYKFEDGYWVYKPDVSVTNPLQTGPRRRIITTNSAPAKSTPGK